MTATARIPLRIKGLAILVAVALAIAVVISVGGGSATSGPVPVTAATLSRAAALAQADNYGYDYRCVLYQAPNQIFCQGQGTPVVFLVDPRGNLALEPGQG